MPTLPEEEEELLQDLDKAFSSTSTCATEERRMVHLKITPPTKVFPRQGDQRKSSLPPRPISPKAGLAFSRPISTFDDKGHIIDLVKDQLPDMQLSEEERQKNLELLEEAKKVTDRFLQRRGRRSISSLSAPPKGFKIINPLCTTKSCTNQEKGMAGDEQQLFSGKLNQQYTTNVPDTKPSISPSVIKNSEIMHTVQLPATSQSKPGPRTPTFQTPCTAEIKTVGGFPPLMRAVSWNTTSSLYMSNPKRSKLHEEHKIMRSQSLLLSKLPDLRETAEQEQDATSSLKVSPKQGEPITKKPNALPNISESILQKLKLQRGLPGTPLLSEKEIENAFVQLSLAFRNDSYTFESRLKQTERERSLVEENTEKEVDHIKGRLMCASSLWKNKEQHEYYQQLTDSIEMLHHLIIRLSSTAEMVGAARQEKKMNMATEVMMQYVENLKRMYEKDHTELMEYKKLANQNSNRFYMSSMETDDDGISRASRSMPLQGAKTMPRRRVSVAVVPKLNMLNIPGQTPVTVSPTLPMVCEANPNKNNSEPTQQEFFEKRGNAFPAVQENEEMPTKYPTSSDKIPEEFKGKMNEEENNKRFQERLKRSEKLEQMEEEDEMEEEKQMTFEKEGRGIKHTEKDSNGHKEVLEMLQCIFPNILQQNLTLKLVLSICFVFFLLVIVFFRL